MQEDLSWRECFSFPIATPGGRRDILIGGLLLFTLIFGWILNLGHRLEVVHRLARGETPYLRGFSPWRLTFWLGMRAFAAIATYLLPAVLLALLGTFTRGSVQIVLFALSLLFFCWPFLCFPAA